jgi:hypothetical protein
MMNEIIEKYKELREAGLREEEAIVRAFRILAEED